MTNPDAITLPCYLLGLPDTFRGGLVILKASSINFNFILGIRLQFLPERATSIARETPLKATVNLKGQYSTTLNKPLALYSVCTLRYVRNISVPKQSSGGHVDVSN